MPGYVRPAMKAHGLLRTYVAQREAGGAGLPEPPAESVAALNTHDMPTWAGFWRGTDVPLREELGLIDHSQAEQILEAPTRGARGAPRVGSRAARRPRRRGSSRVARGVARAARRGPCRDRDGIARRPVARGRPAERAGHRTGTAELASPVPVDARGDPTPTGDFIDARAHRTELVGAAEPAQAKMPEGPARSEEPGIGQGHDEPGSDRGRLYLFAEGTHGRLAEKLGAHVGPDGHLVRRLGAERASSVSVIGDFNGWDRGAASARAASRPPASGPGSSKERARGDLQVPHPLAPRRLPRRQGRPVRVPGGDTAQDRLDRVGSLLRLGRRRVDGHARGAERAVDAPMSIYEVHLGSWRRGRGRRAGSTTARSRRQLAELRTRPRLHPRRAAADHGAPVLRLVGLPDDRLLRADQPVRHAAGPDVPDRPPAPARASA